MGLGRRPESRQQELWIAADQLARTPRHVFYEKLNRLLAKARFDAWVEERCQPHYAEEGRHSISPGVYFRMLLVGYFEGIDSQRGSAWRCADSLSLKAFQFVLQLVEQHRLLSAVGVDSTTLEANAAMKSIVRNGTGENWNQYVTRLMREEGVIGPEEEPTADGLRRYDRKRQDK